MQDVPTCAVVVSSPPAVACESHKLLLCFEEKVPQVMVVVTIQIVGCASAGAARKMSKAD